jgi:uncharacterized protein DUF262/uncharacterized protein DUF1524
MCLDGGDMLDAYNAQPKSIGDLLSDSLKGTVVVPEFQRGYSWGKKHVEAFWEDVRRFQRESRVKDGPDRYFLGPIVIMQPDDKKEITYILDGQQRLATATILFSVLRDLALELKTNEATSFADDIHNHLITKEDYGYCLQMGALDREFFQETVQSHPPTSKKPTLRSHRNILKAREVLIAAVKQTLSADPSAALKELSSLRTIARRDLIMAAIPVKSQRDAFRIFETLNDRGLRLSVPDLLLNYLMGSAKTDAERTAIRKYWDGMIQGMGKRDISLFLRHIWVSKYGDLKNQDLFTALKEHIDENELKTLDFAKICAEECDRYLELLRARKEELDGAAPYINTLVNELGFEVTLPLLLSAHSVLETSGLERVVKWLLVFVTRYTIFLSLDPSGLENTMFSLAKDIRKLPNGKILSHIKATLVRKAPDNAQLEAMKVDGDDFLLIEQSDAVYIVSRIANYLQSNTKEISLNESNLEHIFPKNPAAEWKKAEELEPYLWHLGNLTMLGKRLNGNAANAGYSVKRAYYEKNTELEISKRVAADFQTWGKMAIEKRAKQILPLITKIWDFNNPSRV